MRILAVLALPLFAVSWALFNVWRVAFRQVDCSDLKPSWMQIKGLLDCFRDDVLIHINTFWYFLIISNLHSKLLRPAQGCCEALHFNSLARQVVRIGESDKGNPL